MQLVAFYNSARLYKLQPKNDGALRLVDERLRQVLRHLLRGWCSGFDSRFKLLVTHRIGGSHTITIVANLSPGRYGS